MYFSSLLISLLHSYKIYDADAFSPCRYHLLTRSTSSGVSDAVPSTNGSAPPATVASGPVAAVPLPLPGAAGRWRLPQDPSGLEEFSHMVSQVNKMSQVYTLYYFLQGIILLMLVFHLIHAIGFQARLSVIPGDSLH